MGKLGKKARKFAKKNLQSVLKRKRKRKLKSLFKKKASKRGEGGEAKEGPGREKDSEISFGRHAEVDDFRITSLDAVFGEDDSDLSGNESGSDGFLSELDDDSCRILGETERKSYLGGEDIGTNCSDSDGDGTLMENMDICLQLEKEKEKLERLKEKDPEFSKFLESSSKHLKAVRDRETYSEDVDDDENIDGAAHSEDETDRKYKAVKLLSRSTIKFLSNLVREQHNVPALVRLLNFYRVACHYATETHTGLEQDSAALTDIMMLMIGEEDNIFRKMLGLSCSNGKKETIVDLKNSSKWKPLQPLLKSYLRSTLFLLNEVTDTEILAFTLARLRSSIVFFSAFPSLLRRLIKVCIHLWVTGEGKLSKQSFVIMRDIAVKFSSDWFDTCLIKAYKAFIGHCQFVEPSLLKHIQFLKNSFVELCSQDLQKSYGKAFVSIQQLAKILRLAMKTKKKEIVKKICSWQFANCLDLWVSFLSVNACDYDLQQLLGMLIQIINGVAVLFSGPRYLPFKVNCVKWLNHLSSATGVFIPIASLALDILEYKTGKEGRKPGKEFGFSSSIKLPKHWLKSQNFQEECVFSAIELLAMHFTHWSYHVSFPELATIPIIHLRKFQETTNTESCRQVIKRFIDQVEQNVEFVRKRRDEVSFSPRDQQSVDSFLQLEKCSGNAPFMQYYRSISEKASSRNLLVNEMISSLEQTARKGKRRKLPNIEGGGKSKRVRVNMSRLQKGQAKEG